MLLSLFLQVYAPACDVEQFRADERNKVSVIKGIKSVKARAEAAG